MSTLDRDNWRQDRPAKADYDYSSAWGGGLLQTPFDLLSYTLSSLRQFMPRLVPLIIFFALVPLLVLSSLTAGFIVWKSAVTEWREPIYLHYGDGLPPYADIALSSFNLGQPYDISVHLVLPATQSNLELGNFMTTLTLSTTSNVTITHIRRPAIILQPSSHWFSLRGPARTVDLTVPLLTSFVPGSSRMMARVELGRRDHWKSVGRGETRELSVLSATLEGVAVKRGLNGLVLRFPVSAALISAVIYLAISMITVAACILPVMGRRIDQGTARPSDPVSYRTRTQSDISPAARPSKDSMYSDLDEKPRKKRRRFRRLSMADAEGIPSEPEAVDVKFEEESWNRSPTRSSSLRKPVSLRKRQLRLSQSEDEQDD